MRYIRKQMTVQVIADEIIEDEQIVKELLLTFLKAKTDTSISYRKNEMEMPTSHDRVRFNSVSDNTFDITVVGNAHSMLVRNIPISGIEFISTTVSPSEVFVKKEGIKKGDTLDLS